MSDDKRDTLDSWTRGGGAGFGAYDDTDEELHPGGHESEDSLTETWAYMFYDPEHRISAFIYLWVHPNLKLLTGGIAVWQGVKTHHLQAELFDMTAFVNMARCVRGNGREWKFPNGLRVQILEPFKKIHVGFEDDARGNGVDVTLVSASPPIMRESRKHFDQMLDATGRVVLRGRTYQMSGFGCRDRSWGEPRPEISAPLPPYTWMTGRFPSGMMWNANANDDPARQPLWLGAFNVRPQDVFKDGWLYRDGERIRLTSFSKITKRDPETARPTHHTISMVDAKGRAYEIQGEVIASLPWSGWPNMVCWICCTRWEWNGEVGYGDTQEVQWTDFVHLYRKG